MLEETLLASKYRIKKLLGSGGSGEVYLAERIGVGGEVAVKMIRSDQPQISLKREATLIAGLHHPNICQFFDFIEHNNSSFIVMEYLNGIDLSHYLRHHSFELEIDQQLIIFILKSSLEALSYAHEEKNILHRDIKPANLFLTKHGQLKLLDFGISKKENDGLNTITSQQFTPLYTASDLINENGSFNSEAYSKHHDFFSLGLVIYELIARKRAFRDFEEAKSGNIDFSNIKVKFPALFSIIQKMLNPKPHERYESAREILRDLQENLLTSFYKTPEISFFHLPSQIIQEDRTLSIKNKDNVLSGKYKTKPLVYFILTLFLSIFFGLRFYQSNNLKSQKPELSSSEVEFKIDNEIVSFSSSALKIRIGLGAVGNWIIPNKGLNCMKFSNVQTCRASIQRKSNFDIFYNVNEGIIERMTFSAEKESDSELKDAINLYLKTAKILPDSIVDGVHFKVAVLGKQKLTYQYNPTFTYAMLEIDP